MEYKKLPKEFDKKGFHFKEVWRDGDYCIYSMANDINILSYESFKTHVIPEYEMGGVKIESKEWFPSWAEVGIKMAHSCASLAFAHRRIQEYREKQDEKDNPTEDVGLNIPPGEFTTNILAELNNTNYLTANLFIKSNLGKTIEFLYEKNLHGRGKPSKFFKKIS